MIITFPEKCITLIEENIGNVRKYIVKKIIKTMVKNNKKFMYVKYKNDNILEWYQTDVENKMINFVMCDSFNGLKKHVTENSCTEYDVIIIEDFPYFIQNLKCSEIYSLLNNYITYCINHNCSIILLSNFDLLDNKIENNIRSFVDGYIQIINEYEEDKIRRIILIPKLKDKIYDKPIPFVINNRGDVLYDTRERIG